MAGIVALGAVVRFWALDFGLPYTQARPDETFIIDVALSLLRGEFWPPFYDYPRLYPYAVTLLYLAYYAWGLLTGQFSTLADLIASWPTDWPPFFLLSRGLSATTGTMTILAVHALGRRVGGRGVGLLAALFTSLAFLHVRDSHYGTTDVAMTWLSLSAVWWLLRDDREGVTRQSVTAAALAGLATATKYTALFSTASIGLALVLRADFRRGWLAVLRVSAAAAALGAVFAVALLAGVPFVVFDTQRFLAAMSEMLGFMDAGMAPASDSTNGWWYHFAYSLRYGVGLPLLSLGLAGAAIMARQSWKLAGVFWIYPAACFVVAGSLGSIFARYMVPVVPFLCIGAAIATVTAARAVGARLGRHTAIVAGLVAVLALAPSAWSVARFNQIMAQEDNRVLTAAWIQRNVPRGSTLAQSGSQYGHIQLQRGHGLRLWRWDRRQAGFTEDGQPVAGRPDWIVLQQSPLPSENQPMVLDWLASGYQLAAVFRAFAPNVAGTVYDRQDMFYVPLGGFVGVTRPGPNFSVYRRADAAKDSVPPERRD